MDIEISAFVVSTGLLEVSLPFPFYIEKLEPAYQDTTDDFALETWMQPPENPSVFKFHMCTSMVWLRHWMTFHRWALETCQIIVSALFVSFEISFMDLCLLKTFSRSIPAISVNIGASTCWRNVMNPLPSLNGAHRSNRSSFGLIFVVTTKSSTTVFVHINHYNIP